MSTIIKNLQEMWQNKSFIISEVGKIVRFFLLSQAIKCRKLRHLFCFEAHKNIPQYGKRHGETTDCALKLWCMFSLMFWIILI